MTHVNNQNDIILLFSFQTTFVILTKLAEEEEIKREEKEEEEERERNKWRVGQGQMNKK